MNKAVLSISSEVGNIIKVENFIESFTETFHLFPDLFGKISLSIIEAVNNAILSGNKLDASKQVHLEAWEENNKFYVSVEDEGEGFDFNHIPDPTLPDNILKDAGRGLYIMKTLTDELIFEKNGAKVILVFYL
ncbi:ATP-binding protein [uncultured Odoribacter sp.]|uniref:ATP-binding protein n=1 Tax=uncultured Odoribacter sp. TaxID=876416 RepID=UPI0026291601|nr:ATP-binding protein [uncultured Odoribacter sp.]